VQALIIKHGSPFGNWINGGWLPQYKEAITKAKLLLASGDLIPTNDGYRGAARSKVKSVKAFE
jgi:hypothetical protein